jgi:hypothetical protein
VLIPRWEPFIAGADPHGDAQDARAVAAFMAHSDAIKAKHRLLLGDAFDFRPLRRKASAEEQREHLGPDIVAGKSFIKRFRPTRYLIGNHEFRLWDRAENGSGAIQELCQSGIDEIEDLARFLKCAVFPYEIRRGITKLGKLAFLHGFFVGVNAAARHAAVYGECAFGHTHAIAEAPVPGLESRVARSIGCLCRLDMEYAARTPSSLQHRHGWLVGAVNKVTGDYVSWQIREVGGEFIVPEGVTAL